MPISLGLSFFETPHICVLGFLLCTMGWKKWKSEAGFFTFGKARDHELLHELGGAGGLLLTLPCMGPLLW